MTEEIRCHYCAASLDLTEATYAVSIGDTGPAPRDPRRLLPPALACPSCADRLDLTDANPDAAERFRARLRGEPPGNPLPVGKDAPVTIPGDAPPGDTYSREQAARVLGLSPRRITQLAHEDGRLEVVQASPLRVSAESVHAERDRRRSPDRDLRAVVPPPETSALIAQEVAAVREILEKAYARQIEMGEQSLAEARSERDRLRAEVDAERQRAQVETERLRAEVASERERAEQERQRADAWASRRWWQRKPAEK